MGVYLARVGFAIADIRYCERAAHAQLTFVDEQGASARRRLVRDLRILMDRNEDWEAIAEHFGGYWEGLWNETAKSWTFARAIGTCGARMRPGRGNAADKAYTKTLATAAASTWDADFRGLSQQAAIHCWYT